MERIDKIVASLSTYSRKDVKRLMKEGRITVNQKAITSPEEKIDPETDEIRLDGVVLTYEKYTYIMLHKPSGVLSATEDSRQETVLDLLPKELQKRNLFPVGRLDRDTEGLLLLTNDGDLAHRLLSPKKHVDKVYYVELDGPVGEKEVAEFAQGISIGEYRCMPAELALTDIPEHVFVTLHEGKFHQIKRMFYSCGRTVLYLKRVSMGNLTLDPALSKGAYRFLTGEEVLKLQEFR